MRLVIIKEDILPYLKFTDTPLTFSGTVRDEDSISYRKLELIGEDFACKTTKLPKIRQRWVELLKVDGLVDGDFHVFMDLSYINNHGGDISLERSTILIRATDERQITGFCASIVLKYSC